MIKICIWYQDTTGWFWDDSQDHGGFDRISPMGPFATATEAQRDAAKTFRMPIAVMDGPPSHY